jgi:hypothetical protein
MTYLIAGAQAGLLAGGGVFAIENAVALKQDELIFHGCLFGSAS